MHHRHGINPRLAVAERLACLFVLGSVHLELKETDNDLKVVLDPVVNFADEHLLLFKRNPKVFLRDYVLGYVQHPYHSQFDAAVPVSEGAVIDLTCVYVAVYVGDMYPEGLARG